MNIAAIGDGPAGAQVDLYERMASFRCLNKSLSMQF